MSRRVYEGRYTGADRWEVRRRPRTLSAPARVAASLAVAAGAAARGWERLGAQARTAVVLAAAGLAWVAWRAVVARRKR